MQFIQEKKKKALIFSAEGKFKGDCGQLQFMYYITVTNEIIYDHRFNYTGAFFFCSLVRSGTAAPPTTRLNHLSLF